MRRFGAVGGLASMLLFLSPPSPLIAFLLYTIMYDHFSQLIYFSVCAFGPCFIPTIVYRFTRVFSPH
jgi:hypothetical protein